MRIRFRRKPYTPRLLAWRILTIGVFFTLTVVWFLAVKDELRWAFLAITVLNLFDAVAAVVYLRLHPRG